MSKAFSIDADEFWAPYHRAGLTGAGVSVAVVDSGADAATYEIARERNEAAKNYTKLDVKWGEIERFWESGADEQPNLEHGSAVIKSLIWGAPRGSVCDFRVPFPDCPPERLLATLRLAVAQRVDVLNLSLGSKVPHRQIPEHLSQCPVCAFANRLPAEHDIVVLAAVGNFGNQGMACPAIAPNVLAVGALQTPEASAYYASHPDEEMDEFLANNSSTSYAAAMASAQHALLRSAFPAISAADWVDFALAERRARGRAIRLTLHGAEAIEDLRLICGGWMATFADWRKFAGLGIHTRRELIARASVEGVDGYPQMRVWLEQQKARFRTFIAGERLFVSGHQKASSADTLDAAIEDYSNAVVNFDSIEQPTRAAIVRIALGTALIHRSGLVLPGQIILNDVVTGEECLSAALSNLEKAEEPRRIISKGSALAWRARARTLLARLGPSQNDAAIEDATRAIALLSLFPDSESARTDLNAAHLHLAFAHFFRMRLRGQKPSTVEECRAQARQEAMQALASDTADEYLIANVQWLLRRLES